MIGCSYQELPFYLNYAKGWQAPTRAAGSITSQGSFFVYAVSHGRTHHEINDIKYTTFPYLISRHSILSILFTSTGPPGLHGIPCRPAHREKSSMDRMT